MGYTYSLWHGVQEHKTFTKRIFAGVMAILFAGSIAAAVSTSAATTVVVTPDDTQGWVNGDVRPGGTVEFTEEYGAPTGFGNGSLELTTDSGAAKAQYVKILDEPVALADVNDIAYSTYSSATSSGSVIQAPAINLVIDFNGDEVGGFATLVFEPYYQAGDQGSIVPGEWQDWVADNSTIWWSTRPMPGVTSAFDSFVALETIKASNPDAVVSAVVLNQGTGNPGLVYGVDALTFNGTTFDFELVAPLPVAATNKDECKNNNWKNFQTAYKNQGQCVASVVSNGNSAVRGRN